MRQHVPETGWKKIQANGLEFAYLEEGEGPLILLLHGFPDTAHTWDDIRPRIAAAGFRVVSPAMRGYAPTEVPATDDFSDETLGRDVLALISALGEESAILVGHDWGASAAYSATALGPDRVRKLVAVAIPHPTSIKPSLQILWGARHFVTLKLPGATARNAKGDFGVVRTLYERWSPDYEWPDEEFEAVRNAFAAPGCFNAALGYYRCLQPKPSPHMLNNITTPTLLIGGKTDGVASEADFRGSKRSHDGPWQIAMVPGGHFLHREHPEPFLEALFAFLES